jgi:DUF4097 and DUF4098 domain-containing protein YvlB
MHSARAALLTIGISLGLTSTLAAQATLAVERTGVVVVDASRGEVHIVGWDRSEVSLEGNNAHEAIRTTSGAQVRRVRGRAAEDQPLHVRVPRGFRVVLNGSSNDVTIRDIEGDVEVGVNIGDVMMERIGGRVRVTGIRGDIGLVDVASGVNVSTASGDVTMRNVRGTVRVTTTGGDIMLTEAKVQSVGLETMNGDVLFSGVLADAGRSSVSTHSGGVRLELPSDARAQVEMQSFSGRITSQLPLVLLPRTSDKEHEGVRRLQLGREGGAVLSISTFSGNIEIVRIGARNNN